jgi:hypothetical protein
MSVIRATHRVLGWETRLLKAVNERIVRKAKE